MIKIIKSEFYKTKHTWLPWIHIIIPAVYAFLFFLAAKTTGLKNSTDRDIMQNYFVILSVAFPIVIGAITSKVADMEREAGNFQVILSSTESRKSAYFGKLLSLFTGEIFSLTIAVYMFRFLFGYGTFAEWTVGLFLVFAGSIAVYAVHLFVSIKFNGSASIGLGFVETMLAMLCMTGLGDRIWYFIPGAWSARLTATYVIGSKLMDKILFYNEMTKCCIIAVPMTIAILAASVIWFEKWDGRSSND